jgi:hypothetical protein
MDHSEAHFCVHCLPGQNQAKLEQDPAKKNGELEKNENSSDWPGDAQNHGAVQNKTGKTGYGARSAHR